MTTVHCIVDWIDQVAFEFLISLGLWATIVLGLAWLLSCGLRGSSAAVRYCLWQCGLVSILTLPLLYAFLPGIPLGLWGIGAERNVGAGTQPTIESAGAAEQPPANRTTLQDISPNAATDGVNGSISGDSPSDERSWVETTTVLSEPSHVSWPVVLSGIWVLGVAVQFTFLALSAIRSRKYLRGAIPLADTRFEEVFDESAGRLSINEPVALLQTPQVRVPLVLGVRRPRILLPVDCLDWSTARIRIVLSHELAHIERRDVFWQLLARMGAALYWPHPLVWLAASRMRSEREIACDDCVLLNGVDSAEYAAGLVEVAAALGGRRVNLLHGIAMASRLPLETRLNCILDDSLCRVRASGRVWRRLLLGTACLSLALALPRPFSATQAATASTDKEPEAVKAANGSDTSAASPAETVDEGYTVPISLSGRALDTDGKPISGATVYISSQRGSYERIGETQTDETGRYSFSDVPLPIVRADTNSGSDHGAFIVFGQADGYGFAWRARKWYYPEVNHNSNPTEDKDNPSSYDVADQIELDLRFAKPTTIRGCVHDEKGNPIADTELAIWDCERVPPDGYGPQEPNSTRRPFRIVDVDGFELLNASVPPEMRIRRTDAEGRFVFAGVPIGCTLRINVRPPGFPDRMVWVATRSGLDPEYDGIPLYRGSEEIRLVFATPREAPFQVLCADTGKPAPNVLVGVSSKQGSLIKTTDSEGRASLQIPPGKYFANLLPACGTPYVETKSEIDVEANSKPPTIVARLRRGAEIEIHVVDEETGKGIGNVDLWTEDEQGVRSLHYNTCWEVATHIVHRDRQRTNADGAIRAIFEPGKHRIGVAWESYPAGYRPVEPDGREIDCKLSDKPQTVVFRLRRNSKE